MKQDASDRILLFLKTPAKGRVKTRLASAIGDDQALKLYRNFILDILDTVRAATGGTTPGRSLVMPRRGITCEIWYAPPDSGPGLIRWLGPGYRYRAQQGGELGERMKHALASVFEEGAERALIIGSDLPDLPASVLSDAFTAFGSNDAVLGPAVDGGYYLIGFRSAAFLHQAFDGIPWSTNAVLARTVAVLKNAGLSVHLLPLLNDLDTGDDLAWFVKRNQAGMPGSRTLELARSLLGPGDAGNDAEKKEDAPWTKKDR